MRDLSFPRFGVLVAAVMMLLGLITAGQAGATESQAPDLLSSTPKTVLLDVATGKVIEVWRGTPVSPLISNRNICLNGDGCYFTGRIPYAHQGFYGSPGTFSGSWPFRSGWFTGNYVAHACWVQACSQFAFGPNTNVSFGGALVTGTSFTIH